MLQSRFFGKLALLTLVGMGLCLVWGFADSASAAAADGFDQSSLRGRYAGTLHGRGGQGRSYIIGVVEFDGAGNFTNHFFGNVPGRPFPMRVTGEFNRSGTYTVMSDGLGTLVGDNPDEPDPTDFAIVEANDGRATRICIIIRDLSPGEGSLRSGCLNRIGGLNATFDASSLNGTYGGLAITEGGRAPVALIGTLTFDGSGAFTTNLIANLPGLGDTFPERITEHLQNSGTYQVQADGLCTMLGDNPNPAEQDPTHCVISETRGGRASQVDICFINEGSPAGGLTCGTVTLR